MGRHLTDMKTTPDWQFDSAKQRTANGTRPLIKFGVILAFINLLIIFAAPLARIYLDIPALTAFRIFFSALQAGVVLGLLGLVLICITAFTKNRFSTRGGMKLLLAGLLPAALVIAMVGPANLAKPAIHDITTDPANPPEFVEVRKLREPGENSVDYDGASVAARQQLAYPDLAPIRTTMNPDDALTEATQVVKDLGWEFINVDYNVGIVEAYDTTDLFRFVDDVVIRVRRDGEGSRVDIRSVSRVGKGDLGKNAERIRRFIRAYRP